MGYGYIYKTTNVLNGHVYIGQKRGSFKESYLGSGVRIRAAISKYGKAAFRVNLLVRASDQYEMDWLETHCISEYRECLGWAGVYNIAVGGFVLKVTPEMTRKAQETKRQRGISPRAVGLKGAETCRRNGTVRTGALHHYYGKNRSPELAEKVRRKLLGHKQPLSMIQKRVEKNKGQKRTPEQRARMSVATKKAIHQPDCPCGVCKNIRRKLERENRIIPLFGTAT
jgi:hypothetical protein